MFKSLKVYYVLTFLKYVSSFGHFGHYEDLKSYSDPRFLNSGYRFKSLGLFHPHSGSFENRDSFSEGKKGLNVEDFFVKHGVSGEDSKSGNFGLYKGEDGIKDAKGESGYFFNAGSDKKEHLDGKDYYGKQHFGTEEKLEDEKARKQGHRKGHKTRGFSNSHHNDESGKTEEFYDEEHDEANDEAFVGKSDDFGENSASYYKGGHEDKKFKTEEAKKGVIVDKGAAVKKLHGDETHFGERNFGEQEESFGGHSLLDQGKLSQFSDNNKFVKYHPSF